VRLSDLASTPASTPARRSLADDDRLKAPDPTFDPSSLQKAQHAGRREARDGRATGRERNVSLGAEPDARSHGAVPTVSARVAGSDAPDADAEDPALPPYEGLFAATGDAQPRRRRERPPATAMQRALGLLTRREHSRKELARKLVSRGVDPAEVEAAVEKLASAGWQDERRFAESLVRARASTGYGPLHIRAELSTHDLPAAVRQEALDGFDGDWAEIAADLVHRRFGRLGDARLRERKAVDFLMRRGFPGDLARAAARAIPDGD
jgi:regulatory protein